VASHIWVVSVWLVTPARSGHRFLGLKAEVGQPIEAIGGHAQLTPQSLIHNLATAAICALANHLTHPITGRSMLIWTSLHATVGTEMKCKECEWRGSCW